MKTHRSLVVTMLMAFSINLQAQDTTAPAAAPAQTEMQKRIATTDAQWQAAFKRDVTDVHEAELNKLKLQYLSSLEAAITKASSIGDLTNAVALRKEQKRFGDTNVFLEQDDAADPASVKQLRVPIRKQLAKLEKDHAVRAKTLHAKYDQVLAQTQTQLTQQQKLDDALLVKAKRDEVVAAWITPAMAAAVGKAAAAAPTATPKTAKDLTRFLEGTLWTWGISLLRPGTSRLKFNKDGTAVINNDPPIRWTAVDANTVKLEIGARLKFSPDRTQYEGTITPGGARAGRLLDSPR